jgi:hypothetical protein
MYSIFPVPWKAPLLLAPWKGWRSVVKFEAFNGFGSAGYQVSIISGAEAIYIFAPVFLLDAKQALECPTIRVCKVKKFQSLPAKFSFLDKLFDSRENQMPDFLRPAGPVGDIGREAVSFPR